MVIHRGILPVVGLTERGTDTLLARTPRLLGTAAPRHVPQRPTPCQWTTAQGNGMVLDAQYKAQAAHLLTNAQPARIVRGGMVGGGRTTGQPPRPDGGAEALTLLPAPAEHLPPFARLRPTHDRDPEVG